MIQSGSSQWNCSASSRRRFHQCLAAGKHLGAVQPAASHDLGRSVVGYRHPGRESGRGGVGRQRDGGIPGAGELDTSPTQLSGPIDRQRESPRLERAGRVPPLLLEPDLDPFGSQPVQRDDRCSPFAKIDP
jgi:hypothetical protein